MDYKLEIKLLKQFIDTLEDALRQTNKEIELVESANKARTAALATSGTGLALGIIGIIAAPFTFGASLAITGVAAASSVTGAGAAIAAHVKKAQINMYASFKFVVSS